ncbi:hypothetical protein, partial [Bradyrhizobium sp. MOS002]|uniref:hypothetical protein n=1 Tax=Bradyrhizobium sp. MOS002 TaxID=2133947 RepID=UPI001AECFC58
MSGIPAKRAAKSKKHVSTAAPATKKDSESKARRTTPKHNIRLADLFLWITVVDECQIHPRNGLEEASKCVSAWNKDPVFGVIGIKSGPRDKGPQWLPS